MSESPVYRFFLDFPENNNPAPMIPAVPAIIHVIVLEETENKVLPSIPVLPLEGARILPVEFWSL